MKRNSGELTKEQQKLLKAFKSQELKAERFDAAPTKKDKERSKEIQAFLKMLDIFEKKSKKSHGIMVK
jgi:hypothetical protein